MSVAAGARFGIRFLLQDMHGTKVDNSTLTRIYVYDVSRKQAAFITVLRFCRSKRIPK